MVLLTCLPWCARQWWTVCNLINNVFQYLIVQQLFAYKNTHRRASHFKIPTKMRKSLGLSHRYRAKIPTRHKNDDNVLGANSDTTKGKKRLAENMGLNPTEPYGAEDAEEDALDPDLEYKGETPLEDDLFLPSEFRSSMPTFTCCLRSMRWPTTSNNAENLLKCWHAFHLNWTVCVLVHCSPALPLVWTQFNSHE